MSVTIDVLAEKLMQARLASRLVAQLSTKAKDSVLAAVAAALETEAEYLISENVETLPTRPSGDRWRRHRSASRFQRKCWQA